MTNELKLAEDRRFVPWAGLEVCNEGHVVSHTETKGWAWQVKHSCGAWAFEDANYCGGCGAKL